MSVATKTVMALVLVLAACAPPERPDADDSSVPPEYAVYSAVLEDAHTWAYNGSGREQEYWAVTAETKKYFDSESRMFRNSENWSEQDWRPYLPSVRADTLRAYRAVALQDEIPLEPSFKTTLPVRLVPPTTIASWKKLGENPGAYWSGFWEAYPASNGLWSFSRVAFDADGTQALVYVEYGGGGWTGLGRTALLEKTDAGWKVIGYRDHWAS